MQTLQTISIAIIIIGVVVDVDYKKYVVINYI